MTNFNISRFGRTLRWSAMMTKKEILTNAASMVFAFAVPFVIHALSRRNRLEALVEQSLHDVTALNLGIYIIICMIGGCWLFNNMNTKEQRIMFKMLPATDLEKFVVRAIYVTVVWWVMAFAAFCLADLFRMLVCLVSGTEIVGSAVPYFLDILFSDDNHTVNINGESEIFSFVAVVAAANAWGFWVHSLYVLGGAFFRRRQFVLTTLVHFVIGLVFMPIVISVADKIDGESFRESFDAVMWSVTAVFTLLGLLDWWLSYKIFRRMQVINNKWINL